MCDFVRATPVIPSRCEYRHECGCERACVRAFVCLRVCVRPYLGERASARARANACVRACMRTDGWAGPKIINPMMVSNLALTELIAETKDTQMTIYNYFAGIATVENLTDFKLFVYIKDNE